MVAANATASDIVLENTIRVQAPPTPAFGIVTNPNPPTTLNNAVERFDAAVVESGVQYQKIKSDVATSPADFRPFTYAPGVGNRTYTNTMTIDEDRPAGEVKVSKRHEAAHALLWANLAAAHASPYNMASPIVLCPRDWGKLTRLSERAAMAYNAMLGFADTDEGVREALKKEPGTVEDFAAAMAANSNNVEVALNRVARECLEKKSNFYMLPTGQRKENEYLTLRNYYTWYSLKRFSESNTFTWDYELTDTPKPIFVRLDDQDILEIGKLLGLSAFGNDERPDAFFTDQAQLMWKHQRWQNSMNYNMEILHSDDLPTVREALREYFGKTPEQFLEFSKNYRQGDKPMPQIKQIEPKIIPFVTYT